MNKLTETIKRRYNRTALFYDWMDGMFPERVRKEVLSLARGEVLEVGVGTGKNLSLYPADCKVTGIDFSPGMLERARSRARKLNLDVSLLEMDAEAMSFPDDTFDTVTATCVFCSVPHPVQGLKEIRRVCKPNGTIILLEHVRSDHPVLGAVMDALNPLVVRLVGANINRNTVANIRDAGIKINKIENLSSQIVKIVVGSP